jgi:23S rRNA (cytosine1962-C5)-methyltransferase
LPRERSLWYGEIPEQVQFFEGPVRLAADVSKGQKTGFFFDQAENRAFALRTAGRGRVLDVFSNTGAWGIGALLAGADSATFVEVNAATCALIAEGLRLNGIPAERGRIMAEDAKVALEGLLAKGERFDAVFLDPPAFAKSRKHAPMALRAYRQYNALSMRLVAPGGLLFTSSCSFHVHEERFLEEVATAAREVGRRVRILRRGEQAPDHPVHPGVPETRYLKHFVLHLA